MKAPAGFRFSGVHAGIKPNRRDLALVFSDRPCSSAGCFTTNRSKAAPVLDAERRLPSDRVRAVIINSGNANALTGPAGLQDVKSVLDLDHRYADQDGQPDGIDRWQRSPHCGNLQGIRNDRAGVGNDDRGDRERLPDRATAS